jgi:hypothetical protein
LGALALGSAAVGAVAIGRLAIGAFAMRRGRVRTLTVDNLEVRRLHVGELTIETVCRADRDAGRNRVRTPPCQTTARTAAAHKAGRIQAGHKEFTFEQL